MRPRSWTFTGGALAISSGLALLLAGLLVHLQSRVGQADTGVAQARKDYDAVMKMRTQYRELEGRKARMIPGSGDAPQSWVVFLSQKAKEADLPSMVIAPENPVRGAFKEQPFTVSLDAGAQGTISRAKFVKFLDLVEAQRPGFKSKHLSLKFSAASPDDCSRVSATFSHFERP